MKIKNHFELIDHRRDGFKGLLSVKGVKYTTARDVARRAVDWAFRNRGQMPESSRSQTEKLQGGHIEQFTPFLNSAIHTYSEQVNAV